MRLAAVIALSVLSTVAAAAPGTPVVGVIAGSDTHSDKPAESKVDDHKPGGHNVKGGSGLHCKTTSDCVSGSTCNPMIDPDDGLVGKCVPDLKEHNNSSGEHKGCGKNPSGAKEHGITKDDGGFCNNSVPCCNDKGTKVEDVTPKHIVCFIESKDKGKCLFPTQAQIDIARAKAYTEKHGGRS